VYDGSSCGEEGCEGHKVSAACNACGKIRPLGPMTGELSFAFSVEFLGEGLEVAALGNTIELPPPWLTGLCRSEWRLEARSLSCSCVVMSSNSALWSLRPMSFWARRTMLKCKG
jgi:hypothetical protein